MTTAKDLNSFLSGLSEQLFADESKTTPRFNVFKYIRPNENAVTKILQDLLDPHGSHGQGAIFLKHLLQQLVPDWPILDQVESATVRIQEHLPEKRFLDLAVRIGNWKLVVENKMWTGEQPEQVNSYIEHLKRDHPDNWFFVFLTPGESQDPETCQDWAVHQREKRARSLSYGQLSLWIESWSALCKADRVKVFLNDMAIWAKNPCGGQMFSNITKDEVLNFVAEDRKHLDTLLAIMECFDLSKGDLFSHFIESLKSGIKSRLPAPNDLKFSGSMKGSPEFRVSRSSWPAGCSIRVAAASLDDDFGYGLHWPKAHERGITPRNALEESIFGKNEAAMDSHWLWYRKTPEMPALGDVDLCRWLKWETFNAFQTREAEVVSHFADLFCKLDVVVNRILSESLIPA